MKAAPIDLESIPDPKNKMERELEELQAEIARQDGRIARRNKLLSELNDRGLTHRELAGRLSRASGVGVVEDTVQKAIRKHREGK